MGCWGMGITQSDEYCEIYERFMEEYDEGKPLLDIKQDILASNNANLIEIIKDIADVTPIVNLINQTISADAPALLKDGGIYMLYSTILDVLDTAYYLDKEEQLLSYALPEELIRVEEGEAYYYKNE